MLRSLAAKVLTLPDDVVVLPGHGPQTTIGRERATNPFLQGLPDCAAGPGALAPWPPHRTLSRLPRVAARPSASSSSTSSTPCARSSSCTASPRSRPAPSSRSSRCCARARLDKEVYVLRRLQAEPDEREPTAATLGLHFDLTVPFARYVLENAGQLAVPVPALPDPEGLAGGAPAGGALPRVHPGRHRRHRPRRAVVPPRGRDRAGDGRGVRPAAVAARPDAGQQPQADRGLLPRHRRDDVARRHADRRQARQGSGQPAWRRCWPTTSACPTSRPRPAWPCATASRRGRWRR